MGTRPVVLHFSKRYKFQTKPEEHIKWSENEKLFLLTFCLFSWAGESLFPILLEKLFPVFRTQDERLTLRKGKRVGHRFHQRWWAGAAGLKYEFDISTMLNNERVNSSVRKQIRTNKSTKHSRVENFAFLLFLWIWHRPSDSD